MDNDSIFMRCLAGGIGCGCSGFVTNPMDVVKIKNQQFGGAKYGSLLGTAKLLLKEQGPRAFFKGAASSVLREMTYSSLRMGLYDPIKDFMVRGPLIGRESDNNARSTSLDPDSPLVKWASAFLSGAIGAAIFNPIDLIKVRFQSQLPGQPRPYRSIAHAFATIYREEHGLSGLYNGTAPTVVRAAFLTCAQLGSYDVIKNNLLVHTFHFDREETSTHFAASLIASVVTTTAANPADVVKTRVMNDRSKGNPGKNAMHVRSILKTEGLPGFMKGWTASYLRIGPHTVISFILIERVRQIFGIATY